MYVANERVVRQHRMNIGTIVEAPMLKIRLVGKKRGFGVPLGEVEEYFVNLLTPGDSFMFAGRLLIFLRLRDTVIEVAEGRGKEPKVPAYEGARMPLTTNLAARVRAMLHDSGAWGAFPPDVQEWLMLQHRRHACPAPTGCWSRRFRAAGGGTWWCMPSRGAMRTRR